MPPGADPVLLLHGQPGGARDWDLVIGAIGDRVTTVAMQRPGWDERSNPTDLEGNARAALSFLDAYGALRATIVGHSFGAAVAAWIAARHPSRVRALLLAAPAANVASLNRLDYLLASPLGGPLASAVGLGGLGLALATARVRRQIAQALTLDERYLDGARRLLLSPSTWRTFLVEQRALVRELPLLEERLGEITAPTTIIAGTADRVVSPASARRLATQIPAAEVVMIDGADHLLALRHAATLAELIVAAAS